MNGTYITQQDLTRVGRLAGWAPGNYTGTCRECRQHMVADKRAIHCFICAVIQMRDAPDRIWDDAIETCASLVSSNLFLPPSHREAIANALVVTAKGKREQFQGQNKTDTDQS